VPHVVGQIQDRSLTEAVAELDTAHRYLVACARAAVAQPASGDRWGIDAKRVLVSLSLPGRPSLIGKSSERLGELINIAATIERLLDALAWFSARAEFSGYRVVQCHPSTSATAAGNDLVLQDESGRIRVRCEVSDVAARNATQNNKEKLDLAALGVRYGVPADGVRRFLCSSPEFAAALCTRKRAWSRLPYRYERHKSSQGGDTVLLEVVAGHTGRAT
jgi:hypothetical protein